MPNAEFQFDSNSAVMNDRVRMERSISDQGHSDRSQNGCSQFVRVSNALLRSVRSSADDKNGSPRFSSLRELGLYMMLSGILSNPAFISAPGGLQSLLLGHCRNRFFSLHGAWKKLSSEGWLKRIRIPRGLNRFIDCYDLQNTPNPKTAASVNLSASAAEQYLSDRGAFVPPTEDFTKVSYAMLMDSRLSLSAKGLYAVIARLLRLSGLHPELRISKDMLRTLCGEGKNAFDGLFRELRTLGYLSLERGWDAEQGKICFRYVLCPAPTVNSDVPAESLTAMAEDTVSSKKEQVMESANNMQRASDLPGTISVSTEKNIGSSVHTGSSVSEKKSFAAVIVPSEQDIRRSVQEQIEYPVLQADYPKERLDFIVSILSDGIRGALRKPGRLISLGADQLCAEEIADRYKALDCEDIRFVLDSYKEQSHSTKIHNARKYLMTCLYHAKENFHMALDAFGSHICGDALPI